MIDPKMYQALFDALMRQGYLLEGLKLEFIRASDMPFPLYGMSRYSKHEACQRWKIKKKLKRLMMKQGVLPMLPALSAATRMPSPKAALELILAGDKACVEIATRIRAEDPHAIEDIYECLLKEHNETMQYFEEMPAVGGEPLANFDLKMASRYARSSLQL